MAKKNHAAAPENKGAAAEYYKLNVKAVEDLVTADAENSPAVSEEELRQYRSGPKMKVADWAKVLFIKTWFAGAVCFFFLWGLGYYLQNQLDQIVLISLAWGMVTDLLTNNVLRFLEKTPGAYERWMMIPRKGFISLPLNLVYGAVVVTCVVMTYHTINAVLMAILGAEEMVLGVEPILFGLLTMGWDSLFIQIKHGLGRVLSDAKSSARTAAKKQP